MSKPKNKVTLEEGSSQHQILELLFDNQFSAKNYAELSRDLSSGLGYTYDRRKLGECVNWYNQGLYVFRGKTVNDTGELKPLVQNVASPDGFFEFWEEEVEEEPVKAVHETAGKVVDYDDLDEEELTTFHEFCKQAGIDPSEAVGGWIKTDNLSVRVKSDVVNSEDELDKLLEVAKERLTDEFWSDTRLEPYDDSLDVNIGVAHLSDLHIGSYVKGLTKTPDFDLSILKDKLLNAAHQINSFGFDSVYIRIYGDLVESFSGLNHPNTWKELEQGIHGVEAIKIVVKVIDEFFLSKVENITKVSMIGGNHDRVTSNNKEDGKGGVADLVSFCLDLKGYNVEFNSLVLSDEIDGIQYIMLHGDKGVSKRATKDIIWDYGKQGIFNYVIEGHLHSRIQRLSSKAIDKYQMVTDDSIDCRRQVLPSIFTGNSYSDENNWFSNSGIMISYNNGKGLPITVDIPV